MLMFHKDIFITYLISVRFVNVFLRCFVILKSLKSVKVIHLSPRIVFLLRKRLFLWHAKKRKRLIEQAKHVFTELMLAETSKRENVWRHRAFAFKKRSIFSHQVVQGIQLRVVYT